MGGYLAFIAHRFKAFTNSSKGWRFWNVHIFFIVEKYMIYNHMLYKYDIKGHIFTKKQHFFVFKYLRFYDWFWTSWTMENILLIYKICSQLSGKCPDSCGSWLFSCLVLSRENKKIKFMNLDGWDSKPHGFFLSELLLICRFSILKPLPHDMRHMICLCQWPT